MNATDAGPCTGVSQRPLALCLVVSANTHHTSFAVPPPGPVSSAPYIAYSYPPTKRSDVSLNIQLLQHSVGVVSLAVSIFLSL